LLIQFIYTVTEATEDGGAGPSTRRGPVTSVQGTGSRPGQKEKRRRPDSAFGGSKDVAAVETVTEEDMNRAIDVEMEEVSEL